MIEFEQFKARINYLKENLDRYDKSSFVKKLFIRDKVDSKSINSQCAKFVSEELLAELRLVNSSIIVSECFKLLDVLGDNLYLKNNLDLKRKFFTTITNIESHSISEKNSYQYLKKFLAISELELKNQIEFKRVLKGGSIPE